MSRLPSLFISHGSPMLAIQASPAHEFLRELGKTLPRPQAIIIASAHWETVDGPVLSQASQPETIHDFGGFPRALFEIRYSAPGAPEMASRAVGMLQCQGFTVDLSASRGLDHGAWVPLSLMYPQADIPVAQLSIVRHANAAEHFRMGRALRALRDEGVLVIGSGSLTHNLYEFRGQGIDSLAPEWVSGFSAWMKERIEENDKTAVLHYREQAPFAARNHPTEEHLLPLFVAMGAGGDSDTNRCLHQSVEYGVLAMDIYAFE